MARQKTIDDIRLRFDEDKKRYIDLRKKKCASELACASIRKESCTESQ